jgi:hypothetical protein
MSCGAANHEHAIGATGAATAQFQRGAAPTIGLPLVLRNALPGKY